jgi:hypothetical protein
VRHREQQKERCRACAGERVEHSASIRLQPVKHLCQGEQQAKLPFVEGGGLCAILWGACKLHECAD